jgi:acetyl-CoA/propionyl-CoA carboxylase biotin carboxyl carrier protein
LLESVLIANRGEIARRVIRTAVALGMRAVAVYSPIDAAAPHVREADEAVAIGSYLDVAEVVAAAVRSGAQALHPGYGFLSERAELARACAVAGIVFVGPSPEAIDAVGDKVHAKATAEAAGLPVLATSSPDGDLSGLAFPVLVKAAAGGGGRGMRVVERAEDLVAAIAAARREALAGFGDDAVFLEPYLRRARHVEVQVIADRHGTVLHLGERECSLQRRHQKVLEEAPSPVVDAALRERLGVAAVTLARAASYEGAGTVEFLLDADDPTRFWFLEMNARLQVEHPVTELVTGLDLVELQLRVAAGEPLALRQRDVAVRGFAIEARVTAEDAPAGYLPATGRIVAYREPVGAGVRVDSGVERGTVVTTAYDSLLAKVIAHGETRELALARLERALADTAILGVTTTTAHLRAILATPEVRTGAFDTGTLGRLELAPPDDPRLVAEAAAAILALQAHEAGAGGWRHAGARAPYRFRLAVDGGEPSDVVVPVTERALRLDPDRYRAGGHAYVAVRDADALHLGTGGAAWVVTSPPAGAASRATAGGGLRAPMPGVVLAVTVAVGDVVRAGDTVLVIESMKLELAVTAPFDGTVRDLLVAAGEQVARDQELGHVEGEA